MRLAISWEVAQFWQAQAAQFWQALKAGTLKRPRAALQKSLSTKFSSHHFRHRFTVRALTPTSSFNLERRGGLGPCRSTLISTTTPPKYTFRPRNSAEGGVVRRRHPSSAQQKLSRCRYALSASISGGAPRGLRG